MNIPPLIKAKLAQAIPAGPFPGQHAHAVGSTISPAHTLISKKLGHIVFVAPDPVFFYLNKAEKSISQLDQLMSGMKKNKSYVIFPTMKITRVNEGMMYDYFEESISAVIFMYGAIEAFTNQHITTQASYTIIRNNKTMKLFSKYGFEKTCTTEEKLLYLSLQLKKSDLKKQQFWSTFKEISRLRNDLVHLKTKGIATIKAYEQIYIELIDVDYKRFLDAIKSLLTFFAKDYFVDSQ